MRSITYNETQVTCYYVEYELLILYIGGKSAIMTGIVVALGGKARSTERGSSLKQFIRTGARYSKVVVHLRNRGHEAFKPELYGDTIICERVIRDDGTTAYKVKSEDGEKTIVLYWL